MATTTPSGYHTTTSPSSSHHAGSRGRGNYSNARGKSGTLTRQRGLFADGVWHCDCSPRLPAEHFRVKKDGPNHGRWFYTCQGAEEKRCKFFLWEDDARPREEAAVLNNKRTEPGREDDAAALRSVDMEEAGPVAAPHKTISNTEQGANQTWLAAQRDHHTSEHTRTPKRKMQNDQVHKSFSDTESEGEGSTQTLSWPPTARADGEDHETPSKKQKLDTGLLTPTTTGTRTRKLPWLQNDDRTSPALTTPSKASHGMTDASRQSARLIPENVGEATPTPVRFKDALRSPSPALVVSETVSSTLTQEITSILDAATTPLPDQTRQTLLGVLTRFEMKLQGVVKGRELVRAALKSKEGKVVELQARIAGLEAEREVLRHSLLGLRENNTLDD